MNKLYVFLAAVFVGALGGVAFAAPIGDPEPKGANGAVAVDTTATPVPALASIMKRRNSIAIFNNGPNPIFCGWSSAVTTGTGFPIAAGGSLSVDVRYATGTNGTSAPALYCITTVLQVAPADTRYFEVK